MQVLPVGNLLRQTLIENLRQILIFHGVMLHIFVFDHAVEQLGVQHFLMQFQDTLRVIEQHILQNAGAFLCASPFALLLNNAGDNAVSQQIAGNILFYESVAVTAFCCFVLLRNIKRSNIVLHESGYSLIIFVWLRTAHRVDRVKVLAAQTHSHSRFTDAEIAVIQQLCGDFLELDSAEKVRS